MRKHDGQLLQRDVVDQLVVGALQERRVDRDHGPRTLAGQAGGERHGVLFGDRDVEVAVGKALLEFDQAGALAHRGRDADDAWIALGHVAQPLPEHLRVGRAGWPSPCRSSRSRDRTGPGPCHLIGIGFGGRIALALAGDDVQELRTVQSLEIAQRRVSSALRSWPSIGPM